jgi:hypothetical protein
MNLDRTLRWGMTLFGLLLLVWLSQALEWAEVDTPVPAQGEAASNPWYASQSLITRLGGKVVKSGSLRTLPPPHATLVLNSPHWDLFPGNIDRLHQWIAQGGHLVIPGYFLDQKKFNQWIPVERVDKKQSPSQATKDEDEDDETPVTKGCHPTTEQRIDGTHNTPPRSFLVCAYTYSTLETKLPVVWGIRNEEGYETLRIAIAQGTVTAIENNDIGMREELFSADNAQAWVRTLDLHGGDEVWFVLNEKRPPLGTWLWTHGWIAVLLFACTLALALWRSISRFGPTTPAPSTARRSMAEQVRGTAQFLRRNSAQTLHQAQLRAFNEVAQRHVPHYRSLGLQGRAQSVARMVRLDATALAHSMRIDAPRTALTTLQALRLLEIARRRLCNPKTSEPHTQQP